MTFAVSSHWPTAPRNPYSARSAVSGSILDARRAGKYAARPATSSMTATPIREEDGTLTARAGDTLIMFVEWDRAGKLRSESAHPFGSATMDATSPHYQDQAPLFVAMETKPVRFTRAEREGHMKESYRPGAREAAR